jgi:enediyne biosynthesis protein E4
VLFKNLRNGRFADVSAQGGAGITAPVASRGCAFGDFDNDGDLDFVVNPVNDYPQLVRCDSNLKNNWIKVRTIGVKSNRSGIGARIKCVTREPGGMKPHQQIDEVRSGGSYFSQNDLRIHFGLGAATQVDLLEIRWPSGQVDILEKISVNQLIYVKEGQGIVRREQFSGIKAG